MPTGGVNFDFDSGQHLISFTEHTQEQQNSASGAHSQGRTRTFDTGLAGSVQQAAYARGQGSDGEWTSVTNANQESLVDNFRGAFGQYQQGQDEAQHVISSSDYQY